MEHIGGLIAERVFSLGGEQWHKINIDFIQGDLRNGFPRHRITYFQLNPCAIIWTLSPIRFQTGTAALLRLFMLKVVICRGMLWMQEILHWSKISVLKEWWIRSPLRDWRWIFLEPNVFGQNGRNCRSGTHRKIRSESYKLRRSFSFFWSWKEPDINKKHRWACLQLWCWDDR